MRVDLAIRLLPFAAAYAVAYRLSSGAKWLGLAWGDLGTQLVFGVAGALVMFAAAAAVQRALTRRRGTLAVPADAGDAGFQAAYYCLNAPLEEALFRGIVQGGVGAAWGPALGFTLATALYVGYHRLGRWTWSDTAATALVGVPLGLAYWLLPGPTSLLGVSLAHIGATCGFLGPGPYLLRRLGLV